MALNLRVCLVGVLIIGFYNVSAQVISDFATNADGWTAPNSHSPEFLQYSATGGNPNGYVFAQTPGSFIGGAGVVWLNYYFTSSSKFVGNKRSPVDYYGGTLRYDASQTTTGTPTAVAEMIMTSAAGISLYYFPFQPHQPPSFGTFSTFSVKLDNTTGYWKTSNSGTGTAATEAQVQGVLASLATLQIRGLYRNANVATRIDNVTMYPPIQVTTQPTDNGVCVGKTTTFSTAATNNAAITYQWQQVIIQGLPADLKDSNIYTGTATTTLSVNTANLAPGAYYYRARISGTGVEDAYTNTVSLFVYSLPPTPTVTNGTFCKQDTVVLQASGGDGENYNWYTSATNQKPVQSSYLSQFTTPVLTTTTTYYVSLADQVCESPRVPVVATDIAENPVVTPGGSCSAGPVTLSAAGGVEGQYRWYTDLNTKSPIANATGSSYNTPTLQTTTTFYVAIRGNATCESDRVPVIATIGGTACNSNDLNVYNAVSPNKDGKNEVLWIENIDQLADTKKNHVTVYNRWGDLVWEGNDYNNSTVAFKGISKDSKDLPSGTYFYKIDFSTGKKSQTGYLELKR